MESWCFSGKGPPSPLVVDCDPSTLLHKAVLSVTDMVGLWPGSPWTGLWFWSLPWWLWPCCWPPCTGVWFWFLETYPGRAACSASSALLTNSSLSVWTNCSVCRKERGKERLETTTKLKVTVGQQNKWKFKHWKSKRDRVSERDRDCFIGRVSGWKKIQVEVSLEAGNYLQRERKERRKMNTLLHHKVAALHYRSTASEQQKQQQTTNNSITPPSSLPLRGAHLLWSQIHQLL